MIEDLTSSNSSNHTSLTVETLAETAATERPMIICFDPYYDPTYDPTLVGASQEEIAVAAVDGSKHSEHEETEITEVVEEPAEPEAPPAAAAVTRSGLAEGTCDLSAPSDEIEMEERAIFPETPELEREPEIDVRIELAEIARGIPEKMAFKIGEVAELAAVKPYVLRYWETEFEALNPQKSAFNQRMYSRRDVETVLLIKKLLYEEKFSIAGAKKKLKELRRELKAEKQWVEMETRVQQAIDRVGELVNEIHGIKRLFS